ncbi:MAG TPA: HNH endonuclease signature motif containing protein [Isosphaeraceae bacterium]|nr:HNH endonuclease signature motif containing protein [Isosphaeraceae bacterium]
MPRDYIPAEVERRVRQAARHRCGYCLSPQRLVMARLEIEHIIPAAKGGDSSEPNLWLSCPLCNRFKADRTSARDPDTGTEVPLFNARTQRWSEHFRWSKDGIRVIGLTPSGRATVALLHLADDPDALIVRAHWVLAGWHPPTDDEQRLSPESGNGAGSPGV